MVKTNTQLIQAFPIQANTFVGTATDLNMNGYKIVHASADGDLTFTFTSGDITISVVNGMDIAVSNACISMTSSMEVWVS